MNFLNFGKLPSHHVALDKRNNEIAENVSTPIAELPPPQKNIVNIDLHIILLLIINLLVT
jgi:hypothetical protein